MRGAYAAKTAKKLRKPPPSTTVVFSATDSSSHIGADSGPRDILDEEAQQKAMSEEERLDRMPGYKRTLTSHY